MSTTSPGRRNRNGKRGPTPASSPPRLFTVVKPELDPNQLQFGNVTLPAVDHLTGMTADEIERVAEQVLAGAEVTAAALRELAWHLHENGIAENEALGHFVRVANQYADAARAMQQCILRRDEQPPSGLGVVDDAPGRDAVEQVAP